MPETKAGTSRNKVTIPFLATFLTFASTSFTRTFIKAKSCTKLKMVSYRSCALKAVLLSGTALIASNAFVNNSPSFGVRTRLHETSPAFEIDERTGKRTGNSFLSDETKERAASGNPIEKMKQKKDATAAFVDVYEYAAKIRSGEMEWTDVEKADLDNVSFPFLMNYITSSIPKTKLVSYQCILLQKINSVSNMLECCTETSALQDSSCFV